jgi:hypothetical protein
LAAKWNSCVAVSVANKFVLALIPHSSTRLF